MYLRKRWMYSNYLNNIGGEVFSAVFCFILKQFLKFQKIKMATGFIL